MIFKDDIKKILDKITFYKDTKNESLHLFNILYKIIINDDMDKKIYILDKNKIFTHTLTSYYYSKNEDKEDDIYEIALDKCMSDIANNMIKYETLINQNTVVKLYTNFDNKDGLVLFNTKLITKVFPEIEEVLNV